MTDFSHYSARVVQKIPLPFEIDDFPGEVIVLNFFPAAECSSEWWNASLRYQDQILKAKKKIKINDASIKKNRRTNAKMIGTHLLESWTGVKDSDGNDVVLTKEVGVEFLHSLPSNIFDRAKAFTDDLPTYIEAQFDVDGDEDRDDETDDLESNEAAKEEKETTLGED